MNVTVKIIKIHITSWAENMSRNTALTWWEQGPGSISITQKQTKSISVASSGYASHMCATNT